MPSSRCRAVGKSLAVNWRLISWEQEQQDVRVISWEYLLCKIWLCKSQAIFNNTNLHETCIHVKETPNAKGFSKAHMPGTELKSLFNGKK